MNNEIISSAKDEILRFTEENDVKFIRLVFCDIFGVQKNISIMPQELDTAFSDGISFDASAIDGFGTVDNSDLFLMPEPSTAALLPWRPQTGRVARFYCSILKPDGCVYACDTRSILKKAALECRRTGFSCKIGGECEFYLFKTDENSEPTFETFDKGGYFDMSPLDKCENVRREICLTLEDMGVHPESSHHEQGPGQNEIDFRFSDALSSADDIMTFKTAVKAISARNGLFASFAAKPIPDKSGSGMHINLSLFKDGNNIFSPDSGYAGVRDSFIAGVLQKAAEISLFLNPSENSYLRLGRCEAPGNVSWSESNRSCLIRIPAAKGIRSRMELRSPDPSANPYLAWALTVSAGVYGIKNSLKLPASVRSGSEMPGNGYADLPKNLSQAVAIAEKSEFVKSVLGEELTEKFIARKKEEAAHAAEDPGFFEKQFPLI